MTWWWIFLAGGIGAVARIAVIEGLAFRAQGTFPWGVLVVNTVGCFAIGVLAATADARFALAPATRAALQGGLLGGLTTFSAFGLDTFRLLEAGYPGLAAANGVGNLGLGLLAVFAGAALGRSFA